MLKHYSIYILMTVAVVSCKQPDKEPEFRHITNIRVDKITGQEVLLKADAVFYNPNDLKMTLRAVDVDIFFAENKVGSINQDVKTTIPALMDFVIPFDAVINIRQLGGIGTFLSVMGGQPLKLRYDGHIKVTVHGLPFRIPVDYTNEIRLR